MQSNSEPQASPENKEEKLFSHRGKGGSEEPL